MRFDAHAFVQKFDVSRETIARLNQYEALLKKWNSKINLVSRSTLTEVWHRHFADSAQLWTLIPPSAETWLDFGSGAGFPALVIAIIAAEKRPNLTFTLVEGDQRKCAFLLTVVRELDLSATIEPSRIESLTAQKADVISARAVAPLGQLLDISALHARESTVLLFPKGNSYESELTAAQKHWHIDQEVVRSLTDSSSVILRIEGFERAK